MNNKYNLPNNLNEMPLRDYMAIIKIFQDNVDNEELSKLGIVSHYTGLDYEGMKKMKQSEFNDIIEKVYTVLSSETTFNSVIKIGNKVYGFEPKFEDIETRMYIAISDNIAHIDRWHIAMSFMYRPVTRIQKNYWLRKVAKFFRLVKGDSYQYAIEDFEKAELNIGDILNMSANDAIAANLFFWICGKELAKHSLICTVKEVLKREKKRLITKEDSKKIINGINLSIQHLEEDFLTLKKLQNRAFGDSSLS